MPTKITAPLKFSETSAQVSNLQLALLQLLHLLGFADYEIPNTELEEKKAGNATVKGIMILRDKYPNHYNQELLVDELMAKLINSLLDRLYTINGRLTHKDRQGMAEHTMVIAEYDLDGIIEFDKTITNADGAFSFRFIYDAAFQKADGKTNPDLLFKVYTPSGDELSIATIYKISNESETEFSKLADSPEAPIVLMNVEQEISIRIEPVENEKRVTEFERLVALLAPFMGEKNFAELKEDEKNFQISFLSKESGIEKAKIEMLKNAFAEERNTGIAAWAFFELANLPLPVTEWNNKTTAALAAVLKPLQPRASDENLIELAQKLQAYSKEIDLEQEVIKLQEVSGKLVNSILQSDEKTQRFFDHYARHEGDIEAFWEKMEAQDEFKEQVSEIQFTLQLSQMTLGNADLIKSLKQKIINENGIEKRINDTKDLVSLSHEEWNKLILQNPENIPDHIEADSADEKANIYATELQTLVEVVFPTEVIKQQSNSDELKTFLNHNTGFDFTQHAVDHYITSPDMVWPEGINKETLVQELQQTQRLYSITASAAASKVLLDSGYTSAFQISKLPLNNFAQTLSGKISFEEAGAYHAKAVAITGAAALHYSQIREIARTNGPIAIGTIKKEDMADTLPNWENLFGQIETCECEHCRSVYSPAAYYVDLLHILLGQNNGKARHELFRRRPDLKYTKLTCEHTDTLIPYIDLVIEILETYVANQNIGNDLASDYAAIATNDTSSFSEEELASNPQHPNSKSQSDAEKAYQILSEKIYPLNLPFDLSLETARQFLSEQNSSRYELMQTFGDVNSDACYAEGLGLSVFEYGILTGKKNAGLPGEKDWPVDELYGSAAANLKIARAFLDATNISYIDLIALINTQFLNADQNIVLALNTALANLSTTDKKAWEVANACNLNETFLMHVDQSLLTDAELIKINRFIRLWKKMACTIEELDLLLMAVDVQNTRNFSTALLNDLSKLWQYKIKQNISAEQAATLVNNIPTHAENALYQRLFLNKTILQIDTQFDLDKPKNELKYQSLIGEHIPGLLAAFQITEQELRALTDMAGLIIETGVTAIANNSLSLKNISAVYRMVLFAKTNRIKIHDLFLLKAILPKQKWNTVNELIENQDFIDKIKANDLKAAALAYLFADVLDQGDTLPPKKEVIDKSKQALTEDLKKLDDALNVTKDSITAEFLSAQLKSIVKEESADKIMQVLIPADYIQDEKLELIKAGDFDTLLYPLPLFDTDEYKNVLKGYISSADVALISKMEKPTERLFEYWSNIKNEWINYLRPNLIKKHLVTEFKLEAGIIEFVFPFVNTAIETRYEDVYKQLFKFLWLVNKFRLNANELSYFQTYSRDFADFDWGNFNATQLRSWLRIADYCKLRNSLPKSDNTLLSIFTATAIDLEKTIVAVTGFSEANVNSFVTHHATGNFKNEVLLLQLQRQVKISDTIGVDIAKLTDWSKPVIDAATAQQIKYTLKAKYDESSWPEVSAKVHNVLRNQQRDALVGYLLQTDAVKNIKYHNRPDVNKDIKSPDDLYAYFLIDVEMDAVVKTSRLKQAIASVQLFVQRCIMHLEVAVSPENIDAGQWNWMKNYRVWEANRKVFLYPENWIEPELRDGKSPFFKELESELLQGEVTPESAEDAIQRYLYKLDEVARLDICSFYEDTEANELHVFGRTFNNPPIYYYRKLNVKTHEWTPWEKVQLDIQGNDDGENAGVHLIPVVWNRRLYLFWPLFTEKSDEKKRQEAKADYEKKKKEIIGQDKELAKKMIDDWNIRVKNVPSQLPIPLYFNRVRDTRVTIENGREYLIGGGWYFEYGVNYQLTKLEEKPEPPEPTQIPEFNDNEWLYWEIKMAWSEYKQKHWNPKKVSKSFLKTPAEAFENVGMPFYRFKVQKGELLDIHLLENGFRRFDDLGKFQFTYKNEVVAYGNERTPELVSVINPVQNNFYLSFASVNSDGRKLEWDTNDLSKASSVSLSLIADNGSEVNLLKSSTKEYKILYSSDHQYHNNLHLPLFYRDALRNYFVMPHTEWYEKGVKPLVNRMEVAIPRNRATSVPLSEPKNSNNRLDSFSVNLTGVLRQSAVQINKFASEGAISTNTLMQIRSHTSEITPVGITAKKYALEANLISRKYLDEMAVLKPLSKFDFKPFFHQYVSNFIKALNTGGIDGLLNLAGQQWTDVYPYSVAPGKFLLHTNFDEIYSPNDDNVCKPYPLEDIDFSLQGAYSIYNWELFFHIPMLLANRLSKNQKFEEAMRWYHFIFNPTTNDPETDAKRYWQVLPLRNTPLETLEALMQQLNNPQGDPRRLELEKVIEAWRSNPFNPHLIARMRLAAYKKNALMKYLDNLIAWADNLFRQDTIEQINQATQLYIMAATLLGKRPEKIPTRGKIEAKSYDELEKTGLNAFSNALVQMETFFPFYNLENIQTNTGGTVPILSSTVPADYFCLPDNPKLLAYWDTVADRLFKIRHSLNIEGMERQLALYEPPIDPALLVQAFAQGLDISSILADLNAPLPYYRFGYIVQKALEICSELKSLGNTLLSVLEKKDNEALVMMRSEHEKTLLYLSEIIRKLQIKESQLNREGLEKTWEVTQHRFAYYVNLIANGLNDSEKEQQYNLKQSHKHGLDAEQASQIASTLHYYPNISTGTPPSTTFGGSNLGSAAQAIAEGFRMHSNIFAYYANLAQINAGHERRKEEWIQQKELAEKELKQIDKQILAAKIRESIAEQELTNLEQQVDNSNRVLDFMRNKYTQEELYGWMQGEISTLYFQCYQLAYDLAKKAERTHRHELGIETSDFVQFGIWDSFRKGLMSGERLYLSLKQLEKAYMDQNRREYEITKHISIALLDPLALIKLKENGICDFEIPEALFDMDHPGHYFRRIKSVSISIPCIAGPYTSVSSKLSLLKSRYRKNVNSQSPYPEKPGNEDDRFVYNLGSLQSIATSHGQNDSGVFELNFRDERYLPFEYSGVISTWRLELPTDVKQFDYHTISDVIIHIKYTAREGGKQLKQDAIKAIPNESVLGISVKQYFPNEWYKYAEANKNINPPSALSLLIIPDQLPYFCRGANIEIASIDQKKNSTAIVVKKSGVTDLKGIYPLSINGMNISFFPKDKIENIEDIFLILLLKR